MVVTPLAGSDTLPSEKVDLTPHIGTLFPSPNVQLSAILASSNSDKLLKELASLISERGVVFFKAQDITPPQMKQLAHRLGLAVGKPETSTIHRHPISESTAEFGDEVSVITNKMWAI
jgi:alpha-ketoglutarate-dependent taurine dioxygenase